LLPAAPPPAQPAAATDSAEVANAMAPAAPTAEAPAIDEPALDVTPAAETPAVPDDLVAATFGLLRAEPDGSVVIAGSGTPGSQVEIFSNGDLLGATAVESSGDWVFVPEQPLPPGGVEITLGEAGKPGQAAESFVVVIDEDKTSQPLVVASTPGQASEVLQGLVAPDTAPARIATAEASSEPEAAASAEPAATPEPAELATAAPAAPE